MRPFDAKKLLQLMITLARVEITLEEMPKTLAPSVQEHLNKYGQSDNAELRQTLHEQIETTVLSGETYAPLWWSLGELKVACENIGLDSATAKADRLLRSGRQGTLTLKSATQGLAELRERVEDQIEHRQFMWVPVEKVLCHKASKLFGESVEKEFADVSEDIAEAGRCYAAGRNTACVFHLMRVMEAGTRWLGTQLGIANVDTTWGSILNGVDAAIKNMPKGAKAEAYAAVSAHLHSVKNAWRNPAMHITRHYVEEEAQDIFNHTKAFMAKLASIKANP